MAVTFYYARMSSASPIVWILAELGIPHEAVEFDLEKDAHKQPDFLAINPMGQVPALVDDGQAMFEGAAIAIHLGEKYGSTRGLWPEVGSPEHMVALTWTSWVAVSFGGWLRIVGTAGGEWNPEWKNEGLAEAAKGRLTQCVAALEQHLADREYLTGGSFTLADAYAASTFWWAKHIGHVDVVAHPRVGAWLERCLARPAAGMD